MAAARESEIKQASYSSSKWRWFGLAAVAVVAGAITLWFIAIRPAYQDFQLQQRLAALQAEPGAQTRTLLGIRETPIGELVRLPDDRVFVMFGASAPAGETYQAWEVLEDEARSLKTWQGRAFETEEPLAPQSTFKVTLEPAGGSDTPSGNPIALLPLDPEAGEPSAE